MDSYGRMLWWVFLSSAGGPTRVRLVRALRAEPRNAQQLSLELKLDYTTVRHHLSVLLRSRLLEVGGDGYGQVYFLAPNLEQRWTELEAIAARRSARPAGAR